MTYKRPTTSLRNWTPRSDDHGGNAPSPTNRSERTTTLLNMKGSAERAPEATSLQGEDVRAIDALRTTVGRVADLSLHKEICLPSGDDVKCDCLRRADRDAFMVGAPFRRWLRSCTHPTHGLAPAWRRRPRARAAATTALPFAATQTCSAPGGLVDLSAPDREHCGPFKANVERTELFSSPQAS